MQLKSMLITRSHSMNILVVELCEVTANKQTFWLASFTTVIF